MAARDLSARILARIPELLDAVDVTAALERTGELLTEAAPSVGWSLRQTRQRAVVREHWSPAAEAARRAVDARVAGYLDTGDAARDTPIRLELDDSDFTGWIEFAPLRTERTLGAALLFGSEELTAEERELVEQILQICALTLDRFQRLLDLRAEKDQLDRWFGTMDAQLRVLDRERQKFVAVVNQGDTFMFVADTDLRVTWANAALKDHLQGATEDSRRLVGTAVEGLATMLGTQSFGAGEDDPCPFREALRDGRTRHLELRTEGEQTRDLYATLLPITGPDGRPTEILTMVQDLTDLGVLRRSEARYRLLFERSPDAMLMADPDSGRILLANSAAATLTGWSSEELRARSLEDLHDPEDWAIAAQEYQRVFARDGSMLAEWNLCRRNQETVVANVSANRFDLDGRPVLLLEFRDVTERKMLERELRHSQRMEAIGRLAGGVAHDFNNLLTVILGQSELLARRLEGNERCFQVTEAIRKAAVRGSMLTRQLLAFSRKDVVKFEPIELKRVVHDIEALLDSLAGEDVSIETQVDPRPCVVRIDRGHVEQILMNLAVNARDAMPSGGTIRIEMERRSVEAENQIEIRFHDTGDGMDDLTAQHVFEPFFTTKAPGEGTGLGLSTVYGIVKDVGGTIDVNSRVREGTTFTLRLPAHDDTPVADDPAFAEVRAEAEAVAADDRILLVEDEDDVREMAREALELGGYRVVSAANGEEAIRVCADAGAGEFQLLLTDVIMPGMSGGELAAQITHDHPEIQVLYMSGYNDDAIVKHGVSRAQADFLQKPFTLDSLSRKVREILDRALD